MEGKIKFGDRVRVHLYDRQGQLLGAIEGVASDFAPNTEVAPGIKKNLIWVTQIQDYQRPNEVGEPQSADEGWFADTDIERLEDAGGQQPVRLFTN
jgi:hypothetical protein